VSSQPGRTGLVGVLVPLINDSYFTAMLAGVAEGVYEQGLKLILCPTWHDHAREISLLERLRHETDGTLLILPEQSSDELARILAMPYPAA
jgi:DNA-binding LacI/PurR family transcriptional regulator